MTDKPIDTTFVTAMIFDVPHADFAHVSSHALKSSEHVGRSIPGLIETGVLGNEERTRLVILSRWETKEAWVRSRWDAAVGNLLAELVVSSTKFDVRTYVPIADIEGEAT
jgi:heme-degrading monooxygenase HmoA